MSDTLTERDRRLDEAIAAYMQALALGKAPSRDDWLSAHPDLADDLGDFLADRDRLERWARPLRQALQPGEDTLPARGNGGLPPRSGTHVRYVGDYELLEEIAQGGMGVVFRARQLTLGRIVALKMILAGGFASATALQRFRAEAEAAAALDHPGIVPIYEIGDYQGQPYFSMKLIEGGSLKTLLPELAHNPKRGAAILADVARAVHYAHQHGIIHRDLKPSNVLLGSQGEPHLTDFGLARRTGVEAGITNTGDVLGTPSYMAPEQAAGTKEAATTLADIYSLGAILYEMLTGAPPFRGDSPLETLRRVREDEVVAPSRVAPNVDRDLEAVCLKCLAKVPAERYGSAGELADDLERWLAGAPLSVRPGGLGRQVLGWLRRNIRAAVWVALVGLVGGGLGTFLTSLPAMYPLLTNVGKTYAQFPSLTPPALVRYTADWPTWFVSGGILLGFGLLLAMGPAVIALTRPRRPWNDLTLGLGAGFAAAVTSFASGIGWAVVIALTVVPSIADMTLLSNATKAPVAPATHPADVLVERYPDLKNVASDERGSVFYAKIISDQVTGSLLGLWWGIVYSFVILGGAATVETIVAGYLWRRSGRFWPCVLPYFELTLSGTWLLYQLMMAAGRMHYGYSVMEMAFATLCIGLAAAGVIKRWSFPLRLSLYSTNFWVMMAADHQFERYGIMVLVNALLVLAFVIRHRRRVPVMT